MKLNLAVAAIACAILASAATEAQAQTTLYGCYVKNTGTVYRIKTANAPTKCSANHTEFSWNMEGQVGPQGPQGPAGPAGFSGIVIRESPQETLAAGQMTTMFAWCERGEVVTGGGYWVSGSATGIEVFISEPLIMPDGDYVEHTWRVQINNISASSRTVFAKAICMKLPS